MCNEIPTLNHPQSSCVTISHVLADADADVIYSKKYQFCQVFSLYVYI